MNDRPISIDAIFSSPKLPSLPAVAIQVLELTKDHEVDLAELALVIENDQALATKVLRTVNSSYYGLSKPCSSIQQALAYLGLNTVKTLTLGFCLVESLDGGGDVTFNYLEYWKRGLFSAAAARIISRRIGICDPDETFLGGLMQDIGMIGIYRTLGDRYLQVMDLCKGDHRLLTGLERKTIHFSHTEVGMEIGRKWQMPDDFIEVLRFHHDSESAADEYRPLVRIVELGALASYCITMPNKSSVMIDFFERSKSLFGIEESDARDILVQVAETTSELASLFNLNIGLKPDVNLLLVRAEEQMQEHQLHVQHETEMLMARNEELADVSNIDPLTGLGNRKQHDNSLPNIYEQTIEMKWCLSLLRVDVDGLARINEAYGYLAGDRVLKEIAERIIRTIGELGQVFRIEGSEFAAIIPGATRKDAMVMAEKLRRDAQAKTIDLIGLVVDEEKIVTSLSIGVVSMDISQGDEFDSVEAFQSCCIGALRAAKAGAGNCVRIYSPPSNADSSSHEGRDTLSGEAA